jgi:hypothetical protein
MRETHVTGTWASILTIGDDGELENEGLGDSVRATRERKTVRCAECGKKQPNPYAPNKD